MSREYQPAAGAGELISWTDRRSGARFSRRRLQVGPARLRDQCSERVLDTAQERSGGCDAAERREAHSVVERQATQRQGLARLDPELFQGLSFEQGLERLRRRLAGADLGGDEMGL